MADLAREYLRDLVDALDSAFISCWQSTAAWQKQLNAAREFLNHTADPDLPLWSGTAGVMGKEGGHADQT